MAIDNIPQLGWGAHGIEPPPERKTEGWKVGQRPAAPYFNWLFYNVSEALRIMKEEGISAQDVQAAIEAAEVPHATKTDFGTVKITDNMDGITAETMAGFVPTLTYMSRIDGRVESLPYRKSDSITNLNTSGAVVTGKYVITELSAVSGGPTATVNNNTTAVAGMAVLVVDTQDNATVQMLYVPTAGVYFRTNKLAGKPLTLPATAWRKIYSSEEAEGELKTINSRLSAIEKMYERYRTVPEGATTLNIFYQPGRMFFKDISLFEGRPKQPNGSPIPASQAILEVGSNPERLNTDTNYGYQKLTVINTDYSFTVYVRGMKVGMYGSSAFGPWMVAPVTNETGAMNLVSTLFVNDPNGVTYILGRPGNKRFIFHLESPSNSGTTGGRYHISPSKSVDANDWDFDKGIKIDADTGDVTIKNAITAPLWVGAQRSFGATPANTITIGDSDTGFNWIADGKVDFRSNGVTAAYLEGGAIFARSATNNYYNVGNDIESLKQSGIDYKNRLIAALNSRGQAAGTGDSFVTLIDRLAKNPTTRSFGMTNLASDRTSVEIGNTEPPGTSREFVLYEINRYSRINFILTSNWYFYFGTNTNKLVFYMQDPAGRRINVFNYNQAGTGKDMYANSSYELAVRSFTIDFERRTYAMQFFQNNGGSGNTFYADGTFPADFDIYGTRFGAWTYKGSPTGNGGVGAVLNGTSYTSYSYQ